MKQRCLSLVQGYAFQLYVLTIVAFVFYATQEFDPKKVKAIVTIAFFLTLIYMFFLEVIVPRSFSKETGKHKMFNFVTSFFNIIVIAAISKRLGIAGLIILYDKFFGVGQRPIDFGSWPLWLQVIVGFLATDFLRYWIHRLQHTSTFLWKFHRFHHNVETLNVINLYRSHPLDYFLRNVVPPVLIYSSGFSSESVFLSTMFALTGMFSHCGADLKFNICNKIFSTNQVHRWHHVKYFDGIGYNFGVVLSIWDQLFGTYFIDAKEEKLELGVVD